MAILGMFLKHNQFDYALHSECIRLLCLPLSVHSSVKSEVVTLAGTQLATVPNVSYLIGSVQLICIMIVQKPKEESAACPCNKWVYVSGRCVYCNIMPGILLSDIKHPANYNRNNDSIHHVCAA